MIRIEPSGEKYTFDDLVKIMALLRSDAGCPWDREQDHESIKNDAVEEAYELVEAINNKDVANIREELGDLLLMVLFHSRIGEDEETFTLEEVIDGIASKLVYRHPHVFDSRKVSDSSEVLRNWDELKLAEKYIQSATQDIKQVPKALPALTRARKVQKKASKAGMDFSEVSQVFDKLKEETEELHEAIALGGASAIEDEFGDLLFGMVNLSRFLGVNPENALTNAVEKFINRFEGVENLAKARKMELSELSAESLDQLWEEVKKG